jgi:hypothetical protein
MLPHAYAGQDEDRVVGAPEDRVVESQHNMETKMQTALFESQNNIEHWTR